MNDIREQEKSKAAFCLSTLHEYNRDRITLTKCALRNHFRFKTSSNPFSAISATSDTSAVSSVPRAFPSKSEEEVETVGIPVQLRSSPLFWISPGSLARSPMVSLRKLRGRKDDNDLRKTLTMSFVKDRKRLLEPACLECLAEKRSVHKCAKQCYE
jgi:hypothetical protein